MKKLKINKQLKLFLIAIIAVPCLYLTSTLCRFVYKEIKNYYFNSKNFYFESDKLGEELSRIELEHWNGVDTYNVVINLNSYKNALVKSDMDIDYEIVFRCSSNINCASSKTSGTIYATTNTDDFTITMSPNVQLKENDSVWMEVDVSSLAPYHKTLKGRFVLTVGYYGLSYEISDNKDDLYFELKITNTLDSYTVKTAFDNYSVGDMIDINTYLGLSEENQQKCASAIVDIDFNPNTALLDLTSNAYLNAISTNTQTLNNYNYINHLKFKIDAISSEIIRFYKTDPSQNYTYPNSSDTSVLDVTFS